MLNGSWPGVRTAAAIAMIRIAIFRFARIVVDREDIDPLEEEHDQGRLEGRGRRSRGRIVAKLIQSLSRSVGATPR